MQHLMNKIKAFYQKNRLILIIGFGFILMMQICSRGGQVKTEHQLKDKYEQVQSKVDDTDLKPLREIYEEDIRQNKPGNPEMTSLFILMGLVLFVYVATKRGWLQKLAPSIVWISIHLRKHKQTKERMAGLSVANHTKESITFMSPIITFGGVFKKSRKFRLKSGVGQDVFPLTLVPGTSHQITINLDVFKQKAEGLAGYKWVRFEIEGSKQKTHTSLWKYLF